MTKIKLTNNKGVCPKIKNNKKDMKKRYSEPTVAEQEIVTTNFIATSVDITLDEDKETGSTGAGKRRGEWGDLWK